MFVRLASVFFLLISSVAGAQEAVVTLEEPVKGGIASGVTNIRGWAVADAGVDRIELFVNGQFYSEIPYGGQRRDVESAFPSIPNSINSGFGQTYNYNALGSGQHTFTVRAYMNDGQLVEDSAEFTVAALPEPFYPDSAKPDFSRAAVSIDKTTGKVSISDVSMNSGELVDLELSWSTPTQGYAITSASEVPLPAECSANLAGELDTALFTFTSNSSVVSINGVIQQGSTFGLNLTNGSSEDVSLVTLTINDSDGVKASAQGSDFSDGGFIPAGATNSLTYTVNFLGATGILTADYVLAYEGKCFTLSFQFYDTSSPF